MFDKIKHFVELGLWNKEMIDNVYKKGAISASEYSELIKLIK